MCYLSHPGEYGDCYCDANCVGGNCCNELRLLKKEKPPALMQFRPIQEFDLNEMNTHAVQACAGLCSKALHSDQCRVIHDITSESRPRFRRPQSSEGHKSSLRRSAHGRDLRRQRKSGHEVPELSDVLSTQGLSLQRCRSARIQNSQES